MTTESHHLFYIKTRRQAVKQSCGWICRVFDFFGELKFVGKGKFRKDAVDDAKEFERGFIKEQKAERERFRKATSGGAGWADVCPSRSMKRFNEYPGALIGTPELN